MRKIILIACLYMLILPYNSWGNSALPFSMDSVQLIPFQSTIANSEQFKRKLISSFKGLSGIKASEITKISYIKNINIKKIGNATVFKILFSKELPTAAPKCAFLLQTNNGKAALFLLDDLFFIKEKSKDNFYLISGLWMVKSRGYYFIFSFQNNYYFKSIINSATIASYPSGVAVYNNGLDCISYQPFMLQMRQADLNKDGYLDIIFTGSILFYCNKLETGIGREDRKPISKKKIIIEFISNNFKSHLEWQLKKCDLCKKI